MELSVGRRLRELRERAEVSQRELARRSGQSPGAVSAIELDKVSPSVQTLKRLLDCLRVSLADFFSVGPTHAPAAFFGPDDMVDLSLGPIHYRHLGRDVKNSRLQFIRATARPGSDTGMVKNRPDSEEIGFVLSGRIHVTIEAESRVLSVGEGYIVRGGQQNRVRNIFDEPCEYVFVSSPPGF
jgi:transcriptional regulator with XRE-family HTH domain